MSGNDDLNYNFAQIDSVQALINSFCNQMDEHLAEVDGKFQALLSEGWQGGGATAFQGKSAQWHQGAESMRATLQKLAGSVGNASVNMQAADRAAQLRFS
jgi:WXG100 family type VII secretion target